MTRILLKNGEAVLGNEIRKAHILIENEKIAGIFDMEDDMPAADEIIDLEGKTVLPGIIDMHVHFREPGFIKKEDFFSGSKAAVKGGVTTVIDMPNNEPPIFTVKDLNGKRTLIRENCYTNFGLYMGYNGENIDEINNAENIAGVKIFAADSTGDLGVNQKYLEKAFKEIRKDKLLLFHAEDPECIKENEKMIMAEFEGREAPASVHSKIRSIDCALKMTGQICELSKKYDRRIHVCHITSEEEADLIESYRAYNITCEVTPHHLALSEDDYDYLGNFIKINPPLRGRMEIFGLWKCLKSGLIDVIASDHAPHLKKEKEQGYRKSPSGVPGVETLLPILLNTVNNEGLSLFDVVELCCKNPAKILRIQNKGEIKEGFDADLTIVDMELEKELLDTDIVSKCGWSPYSESVFKGWPVITFVNGKKAFDNGGFSNDFSGRELKF